MDMEEKLKELKTKLNDTNQEISFYQSMIEAANNETAIIETFNIAIVALNEVKDAIQDHINTINTIMEK